MGLLLAALIAVQDLPSRALTPHATRTAGALLTPEGKLLVTIGDPDKVARVWITDTGKQLYAMENGALGMEMSPDGSRVAISSLTGTTVWDPATGMKIHTLDSRPSLAMAFMAGGKSLRTVTTRTTEIAVVTRWDLRSGEKESSFELPYSTPFFRTNGALLALYSRDGSVRIWDLETQKETKKFPIPAGALWAFTLRPDAARLVTFGEERAYVLWDVAVGKEIKRLAEGTGGESRVGFSQDGALMAIAADDGIEVWDGAGEKRIAILGLPKTGVFQASTLSFSADSRTLLAGGTMILRNAPKDQKTQGSLYFWKLKR